VTYGYDQVIDLDLKSYFDTIDHDLLMKLVERRVRDPRVLQLIRGGESRSSARRILEETRFGSPQGAVISPLLSNIYLHPLDLYWEREVKRRRWSAMQMTSCAVPMEATGNIHAEAEAVPGAAAGDCQ